MANVFSRLSDALNAAKQAWLIDQQEQADFFDGLLASDRRRVEEYTLRWNYYRGKHKPPLKLAKDASGERTRDDNIILNYSRRIVSQGVFFLINGVRFEIEEGIETPAEKALDKIWGTPERLGTFLNEVAVNGGVTGDFYIQTLPDEDGNPRAYNLDPSRVFPRWMPHDIDQPISYDIRWFAGDALYRQVWELRSDGRWWYYQERKGPRDRGWTRVAMPAYVSGKEATASEQEWQYDWCPIHHGKNLPTPNRFFGESDLEDADINDAINLIASNTSKLLKMFAHPMIWGHFLRDQMATWQPDVAIDLQGAGELHALEVKGDIDQSLALQNRLIRTYHQIASVPENDPETLKLGAMSGFALRILFSDLLQKTAVKRLTYGRVISEVNSHLLEMAGFGPGILPICKWEDPLPTDERAQLEMDKFELESKLASKRTIQRRRGLDPDVEDKQIAIEAERAAAFRGQTDDERDTDRRDSTSMADRFTSEGE
jgi:hypothetical protein